MRKFAGVAATLFAAVGCSSEETFTDAGLELDATATDASIAIDANPPGEVTVTTFTRYFDGVPAPVVRAGVTVVAIQPDGTVADTGTSDASGNVTLSGVLPGATVSAIYADENDQDLVTFLGVKPGDHLRFGEHASDFAPIDQSGAATTATINFANPAGTTYQTWAVGPCGANSVYYNATSITLPQYDGCQTDPAEIVLQQVGTTNSQPVRQITLPAQAFADNQVIDLTATAWGPVDTFTFGMHGLDDAITNVGVEVRSVFQGSPTYAAYGSPEVTAGAATEAVAVPPNADSVISEIQMSRSGNLGDQSLYQTRPGTASSSTVDVDVQNIPWLGEVVGSAAAQLALWPQVGVQPYDGGILSMYWSRYVPDGGEGGTYAYFSWNVIIPPGFVGYQWDSVPAALADYVPATDDNVSVDVAIVDLADADGYDDLRGEPEWAIACVECAFTRGELTGDAYVSYDGDGGEGFSRPPGPRQPVTRPRLDRAAP